MTDPHDVILSEVTGLTVDEIRARLESGKGVQLTEDQTDALAARLAERERAHFEQAVTDGDYETALSRIGSTERPAALVEIAEYVGDDELRALLAEFWITTDSPGPYVAELLTLFRRAGYVSDTDERLTGELVIYRGTFGDGPDSGLSWTLVEERARWFAERLGSNTVWRARVNADAILGYFTTRNEAEIVADPETLRDVQCKW